MVFPIHAFAMVTLISLTILRALLLWSFILEVNFTKPQLFAPSYKKTTTSRTSFKEERATIICIPMGLNNFNLVKLIPKVVDF